MISKDIIPPPLQVGDKVGLIAPGFNFDISACKFGLKLLKKWGLKPILRVPQTQYYFFSASDLDRLKTLQNFLDDPDIKAIYCIRGGYGTSKIVDDLNFETFLLHPKWLIGFSDITVLHSQLHNYKIQSLHAPLLVKLCCETPPVILKKLKQVLFTSKTYKITFPAHKLNRLGKIKGQLVGGNLSVLVDNIGTNSSLDPTGKILFLEDIGEKIYRIDAMINHLQRIGYFDNIKALLIGYFTEINDTIDVYKWLKKQFKLYQFPLAFGLPVGHLPHNVPIIHSSWVKVWITDEKTRVKFLKKSYSAL